MQTLTRKYVLNIAFAIALAIFIFIGWLVYQNMTSVKDSNYWVSHTHTVIEELDTLLSRLIDAETGQRGFIITGDDAYLELYNSALANIQNQRNLLRELTKYNPLQQKRLDRIDLLIDKKVAELKTTIDARKSQSIQATALIVESHLGKPMVDEICKAIAEAQDNERQLLLVRTRKQEGQTAKTIQVTAAGGTVCLLLLIMVFFLLNRDVAQRTRAEIELERALTGFTDLYDFAPIAYFTLDHKGIIHAANLTAATLLGIERARLIGRRFDSFLLPAARPAFTAFIEKVLTSQAKEVCEAEFENGGNSPLFVRIEAMIDASLQKCSIALVDITERKRAEEAQAQLAALVDSSDDAIIAKSLNGIILSWNTGSERLFGYRDNEVIGKSMTLLIPSELQKEEKRILRRLWAGERIENFETVRLTKDGRRVEVSITASPIKDSQGRIIGASKIVRDITERKRAEEALSESEKRYRSLFENMLEGFAYCRMLYDDHGSPVDFVYLDTNSAFGRLIGLENVKGKRVTEIIPGIKESNPELFETCGRVALTGKPERFEIELTPLKLWLSVSVYGMERECFVAVFDDITVRKRAESVAQARFRMLAAARMSLGDMLQMTLDEIEAQTGSEIGFYHFFDADQETLSLQKWSSKTLQNMCSADGEGSHYPVSQAGVWVDCVHERGPVIHNDYASLPNRKGMPPGHASVIREMVIPILRQDRIVAIIGVGNKPTDYNAIDVEIASLLGDFSWEIVGRKIAEEKLQKSKN